MKDNKNITPLSPVHSYVNTYLQISDICKDNYNKTGESK
jgi:hypothetical protein